MVEMRPIDFFNLDPDQNGIFTREEAASVRKLDVARQDSFQYFHGCSLSRYGAADPSVCQGFSNLPINMRKAMIERDNAGDANGILSIFEADNPLENLLKWAGSDSYHIDIKSDHLDISVLDRNRKPIYGRPDLALRKSDMSLILNYDELLGHADYNNVAKIADITSRPYEYEEFLALKTAAFIYDNFNLKGSFQSEMRGLFDEFDRRKYVPLSLQFSRLTIYDKRDGTFKDIEVKVKGEELKMSDLQAALNKPTFIGGPR